MRGRLPPIPADRNRSRGDLPHRLRPARKVRARRTKAGRATVPGTPAPRAITARGKSRTVTRQRAQNRSRPIPRRRKRAPRRRARRSATDGPMTCAAAGASACAGPADGNQEARRQVSIAGACRSRLSRLHTLHPHFATRPAQRGGAQRCTSALLLPAAQGRSIGVSGCNRSGSSRVLRTAGLDSMVVRSLLPPHGYLINYK